MAARSLIALLSLLLQPEVGWGLRGLVNLYGAPSSSSTSMGLSNAPEVELASVEALACPVTCAHSPSPCLAYATRPSPTHPTLFTCRLFNRTDLVTLDEATDDVRAFKYFILISSEVIEPEVMEPEVQQAPPAPLAAVRQPPADSLSTAGPPSSSLAPPTKGAPVASADIQPEATPTFIQSNGSTYYASYRVLQGRIVREELVTHAQAQVNCTRMGLQLVSIESEGEQEVVEGVIKVTSEGGQTGLSRSFQEFWTSGTCPSLGPCVWGPNATYTIDQQDYTNWLTSGAPAAVSIDTMYGNQWRRRPDDARVWYLCDDGAINQFSPRTTRGPRSTTTNAPKTTTNGPKTTTNGPRATNDGKHPR